MQRADRPTPNPTLDRLPRHAFGYAEARHLLWRAGFGGTAEQVQTLADFGLEKAVEHLIDYRDVPYDRVTADMFNDSIMRPASEQERQQYRRAQQAGDEETLARFRLQRQQAQRTDREQMRTIRSWWLTRMIESPRPLEEKMTLFWHGHFATSYRKVEDSWLMFRQNQFFRSEAVGDFGALLRGIVRDPAMIIYLDNNRSSARQPNENLARELMELFSLGEGNYTERDIKEGARALTGYTYDDNEFSFEDRSHDKGSKNILGRSGRLDGDGFVSAILAKRACSEFLATKLYRFFVAEVPMDPGQMPEHARRFISQLAGVMRESDYRLAPVLRALFQSEHFYHASVRNEQIKSPTTLVVGAIRSLLPPQRDINVLADALDLMGQSLFMPPSVKGWPGGRSWINTSTLFVRQNILNYILTGKLPQGSGRAGEGEPFNAETIVAELARVDPSGALDAQRVCEYLMQLTLGRAPEHARRTLTEFVDSVGGRITPQIVTGMLVLVCAMPEYQLC